MPVMRRKMLMTLPRDSCAASNATREPSLIGLAGPRLEKPVRLDQGRVFLRESRSGRGTNKQKSDSAVYSRPVHPGLPVPRDRDWHPVRPITEVKKS